VLRPFRVASIVGIAVSITLVGCGGSSSTSSTGLTRAAPATRSSVAAPKKPSHQRSRPARVVRGLTDYGATTADWNSTHTPDSQFAPGAVYNPDPGLSSINGNVGAAYTQVLHENGHVLQYQFNFHPMPISRAKALVLQSQFPPDAKVLWFATRDTCAQMMVQSNVLGRELGGNRIGDGAGTAQVEFGSGDGNSYSAGSVNDALFQLLPNNGPDAVGC
jgi:hypothetical protein